MTPRADFVANFTYPFAPDVTIQKSVTPSTGPLGINHSIAVTVQNLDNVTVTNLNVTDYQASQTYQKTLKLSPSGMQTGQYASFPPSQTQTLTYSAITESSGTYVLSTASADFLWQAPNGTTIRYTILTTAPLLSSSIGPLTQFTRTFTDLQPFSYLLLIPLLLTPIVETLKLVSKHGKKNSKSWRTAPSASQNTIAPSPPPTGSNPLVNPPATGNS